MNFESEYNKMRPYRDNEVPAAIERIIDTAPFRQIVSYLYEGRNIDEVLKELSQIKTVLDFQLIFSHHAVREIVRKTSDGLTYSGLDKLDKDKGYFFIANHRDIVLDSAIMQILLVENDYQTSQITFGSNLMVNEFIVDLGKLNKMFNFYRGGSKIQMYRNAMLHSKYIQRVITEENESIWIAQRDGRTKNGNDKTQVSLIKMLTMGKDNPFTALKELNIVPVTISYEYEPCDARKVQEQYIIAQKGNYQKQKGEDMDSVLKGITNYKGRIHIAFGDLMTPVIEQCEQQNMEFNDFAETVATAIDKQVYRDYMLRPNNYIASDLLSNTTNYLNSHYDEKERNHFIKFVEQKITALQGDNNALKKRFYEMYAMPLINKLSNS